MTLGKDFRASCQRRHQTTHTKRADTNPHEAEDTETKTRGRKEIHAGLFFEQSFALAVCSPLSPLSAVPSSLSVGGHWQERTSLSSWTLAPGREG